MTNCFNDLIKNINKDLLDKSGSVFYTGADAFSKKSRFYILGSNPGGCPEKLSEFTIRKNISEYYDKRSYSAFEDESWNSSDVGGSPVQRRVRYLLSKIEISPKSVPASNVIFVRSKREKDLSSEREYFLDMCWPFHKAVIDRLEVEIVICMGRVAGRWVRTMLGANDYVGCFREKNLRGWKSEIYANSAGVYVLGLTHPSVADWCSAPADPSPLLRRLYDKLEMSPKEVCL
ncbi:MAG: uracil-DNA glycosylase family protein [Rhizobiales bacterium]|nr:uracil-DNA glycosylase family protein [Hyphomicrobiales bacterium]